MKKSCWKSSKELGKMIKNGFEVPNCIPDSEYDLNESRVFVSSKNRELQSKFKKAKKWLDDIVYEGDKDYAEKLFLIIDKWMSNYEDKIRNAKSAIRESRLDGEILAELNNIPDITKILKEATPEVQSKINKFIKDWGALDVDNELNKFKKETDYSEQPPEKQLKLIHNFLDKFNPKD